MKPPMTNSESQATDTPPVAGSNGRQHGNVGNQNAVRHYQRSRYGYNLVNLPAPLSGVTRSVKALRVSLESAVVDARGTISVADADTIDAACNLQLTAKIWHTMLRTGCDVKGRELTADQWFSLPERLAKAVEARSRCVERLNLPSSKALADPWASIHDDGDRSQT